MAKVLFIVGIVVAIIVLILIGTEVAFAIGIMGVFWIIQGDFPMIVAVSRTFGSLDKVVLLAIPFFILAGELMTQSKITDRLVLIGNLSVGRLRGGLAQANVATSMVFAGLSGAAVADVAALGTVFIPSMRDEGYDGAFSAALTAASSVIGPIIPPSIIIVLFGAVTNTSIGTLFVAAAIPGTILGLVLIISIAILSYINNFPRYEESVPKEKYLSTAVLSLVALTMPAIILGGIVGGFFTPTEAAAVASVYAFFIGASVYRTLSYERLINALRNSVELSAQLYIIIGLSGMLSWLLSREGVPTVIAETLRASGLGGESIMIVTCIGLLFVGTWLDIGAAIVILAPTLTEVATQMGLPRIQFGMVMIMALTFGLITPPLGLCLFAASGVSGLPVEDISRKMVPFYAADIIVLLLLIYIPQLTLFLPRYLGLI